MDFESRNRMEKLIKENKLRAAKRQLIDDLLSRYDIDISKKVFVDYSVSENLHKRVYEKIKGVGIKTHKFYYELDIVNNKLDWIFEKFRPFIDTNIVFFPSTFTYFIHDLYSFYSGIAIMIPFSECIDLIFKLIHETHDDIIVVEENLLYGFVVSEDEYDYVTIEYWGV